MEEKIGFAARASGVSRVAAKPGVDGWEGGWWGVFDLSEGGVGAFGGSPLATESGSPDAETAPLRISRQL